MFSCTGSHSTTNLLLRIMFPSLRSRCTMFFCKGGRGEGGKGGGGGRMGGRGGGGTHITHCNNALMK